MADLSYGISTPEDLLEKLKRDVAKLTPEPHPDYVFNFIITAATLNEWLRKVFRGNELVEAISSAFTVRDWQALPVDVGEWIRDASCVPNRHCDIRRHVLNVLALCWDIAGASKHFHWQGGVRDVQPKPIVGDWYQYFFTSVAPDLYVDYDGEVYGLSQISGLVLQFYQGALTEARRTQEAGE
jgi:hypothetical protein